MDFNQIEMKYLIKNQNNVIITQLTMAIIIIIGRLIHRAKVAATSTLISLIIMLIHTRTNSLTL